VNYKQIEHILLVIYLSINT